MPFPQPPRHPRRARWATPLALALLLFTLCSGAAEAPPDEAIALAVTERLLREPGVRSAVIDVAVDRGVVSLTGTAAHLLAKERAITNGIAALSGTVDTWHQKAEADAAAAGVPGVRAVDNALLVTDRVRVFVSDPYLDEDWHGSDFDWQGRPDPRVPPKGDWEIRADARDELFWSPFVSSDAIEGTVESWSERQTAEQNAYEAGAVRVDNDLRVRYGPDDLTP